LGQWWGGEENLPLALRIQECINAVACAGRDAAAVTRRQVMPLKPEPSAIRSDSASRVARIAAILALSGAAQMVVAQTFTILAPLAGHNVSMGYAISSDGSTVVGQSGNGSNQNSYHAARWVNGGPAQDLGVLSGGTHSLALAASANGSVVVGRSTSSTGVRGFTSGGVGMSAMGAPTSECWAVNANGSVMTGYYPNPGGGGSRAFRWTSVAGMQSLGLLSGAVHSHGAAISEDGTVFAGSCDFPSGERRAFRTVYPSVMQDLGVVAGAYSSQAWGVSGNGQVIVGHVTMTGSHQDRAMRWTPAGGMQLLNSTRYARALATSGDGSVVVGDDYTGGGGGRAFVWTAQLGMVDLAQLLVARGVSISDWQYLQHAGGVSADGKKVAGFGQHYLLGPRAFVVTIPPPPPPPPCFANCDGSTAAPALTPNDFTCFLNAYSNGLSSANCDGSTGTPALTPNDFQCFINGYAAGCS
jgi:probable HAF family extracellular repeat protein